MKKLFFTLVFISSLLQAQYKVVGTIQESEKYDYAILYKLVGAKQEFVQNTTIKNGSFYFDFDQSVASGMYRIAYNIKNGGFVDFLYNQEDVVFSFDPKDPVNSILFSKSEENKLYRKFLSAISYVQYTVDSLQVAYLKMPLESTETLYKQAVESIVAVQGTFAKKSAGMLVYPFINATNRYNAPAVTKSPNEYLEGIEKHFFDHIDFENKTLYNSSFLVDRISDYVFYMNSSNDLDTQIDLYKKASTKVINSIKNTEFKRDVIKFLIGKFASKKNLVLVDYLFESHFDALPKDTKNKVFKEKILSKLRTETGRIAPDFSWVENGKTNKLSELNDGENFVLIFWSSSCSHCTREIPKVYEFLKEKPTIKVIAFAMEDNDVMWKKFIVDLKGWHHALGLNKWENETANLYNISSTPTYFVLDANKKIIEKPESVAALKLIFD